MKKILLLLLPLIVTSCGILGQTPAMSQSYRLYDGMTMDQVREIMGTPCASEISKGITEWHYCSTGFDADEYVACYFQKGHLIAVKNYTVTIRDVGGAQGNCRKFIKRGTYREPDVVIAVRSRYGD